MTRRRLLASLGINSLLLLGAIATATPLLWMLSASMMPTGEATAFPPRLLPSRVTFEHYRELFVRLDLGRSFLNSAIIAGLATIPRCWSRRWPATRSPSCVSSDASGSSG